MFAKINHSVYGVHCAVFCLQLGVCVTMLIIFSSLRQLAIAEAYSTPFSVVPALSLITNYVHGVLHNDERISNVCCCAILPASNPVTFCNGFPSVDGYAIASTGAELAHANVLPIRHPLFASTSANTYFSPKS